MASLKVHYFHDCRNIMRSSGAVCTSWISDVTCGQCKGKILEAIRAMDWKELPQPVLDFFWQTADKKEESDLKVDVDF